MKMNRKGFTLIEVVVVAGIIAILAGILVPMIFNQIDESKNTRTLADCKSIQSAILSFRKDVGVWPTNGGTVSLLVGSVPDQAVKTAPAVPASISAELGKLNYTTTSTETLYNHLSKNGPGYPDSKWKGPYASDFPSDPWNNPYIINATNLELTKDPATGNVLPYPVWVLSAGPNGKLETDASSETLGGDDIGVRLK